MPQFGIVYVDFTAAAAASDRLQSLTRYVTIGPTAYFTEMTGHLSPGHLIPENWGAQRTRAFQAILGFGLMS